MLEVNDEVYLIEDNPWKSEYIRVKGYEFKTKEPFIIKNKKMIKELEFFEKYLTKKIQEKMEETNVSIPETIDSTTKKRGRKKKIVEEE